VRALGGEQARGGQADAAGGAGDRRDLAIEAFGPARLMFGSDWPVCRLRTEYATWVTTMEGLTRAWSSAEQAAFWGGTAARVYGIS